MSLQSFLGQLDYRVSVQTNFWLAIYYRVRLSIMITVYQRVLYFNLVESGAVSNLEVFGSSQRLIRKYYNDNKIREVKFVYVFHT